MMISANQKTSHLAAVDFKKAFDSVDHEFLLEVLKKRNFDEGSLNLIRALLKSYSCVSVDGKTSNFIELLRGFAQGDPHLLCYFSVFCY